MNTLKVHREPLVDCFSLSLDLNTIQHMLNIGKHGC